MRPRRNTGFLAAVNASVRYEMGRQVIDSIPSGQHFQNCGLLIRGMVGSQSSLTPMSQDVAGMTGGFTFQRLTIHGGNIADQLIQVNGLDVTDGRTQGNPIREDILLGRRYQIPSDVRYLQRVQQKRSDA